MPTNQTTFNSRVTSEALEKKFRDTFPSQGGAELIADLYASGVIVPTVDFTAAAQGSELQTYLQRAWDFATGSYNVENSTQLLINTPGFWQIDLVYNILNGSTDREVNVQLSDGFTTRNVYRARVPGNATSQNALGSTNSDSFIVFVRTGETISAVSNSADAILSVWFRQVADVNGNLRNPLGFTFS